MREKDRCKKERDYGALHSNKRNSLIAHCASVPHSSSLPFSALVSLTVSDKLVVALLRSPVSRSFPVLSPPRSQSRAVVALVVARDGSSRSQDFFLVFSNSRCQLPPHRQLPSHNLVPIWSNKTPLLQLMNAALIVAKQKNYSVTNALDVTQNETFLKELKFGLGDGKLHYYLYNYRIRNGLKPSELGLVLL
ncbi:hypothetical protein AHAS_Ahas09G0109700 [Arachis hypogaea]